MNFLRGFLLIISYFLIINTPCSQDNYKQYSDHSYQELDSLIEIALHVNKDLSSCILYTQAAREKARSEFNNEDSTFVLYTANLGYFFSMTAEYDKALLLYTQAKDIREKVLGSDHHAYAQMLQALADLYRTLGNYSKALSLYKQAKDIQKKTFGEYSHVYGSSINNMAAVYYNMGDYSKALALFFLSKKITAKTFGEDHFNFAIVLSNIGNIHEKMGDYSKALKYNAQSKAIIEKTVGENHSLFSSILDKLATLHRKMGNNQEALSLLLKAKDINERLLGPEHPSSTEILHSFAFLYLDWGKYDQALNYIQQVIKNASTLSIPLTFDQAWLERLKNAPYPSNKHLEIMLTTLPLAYKLLDRDSSITDAVAKQLIVADLANALFTKARNQISNEADKLRLLAKSSTWLKKHLQILSPEQNARKAFQLSDQNKSVLLLQATKSETNYRLGELPDSLISQDKRLLKKQSELQAKLLEDSPNGESNLLRNQLNNINQDIDAFEKMIAPKFPKYYQLKYKVVDTKVEDIQALLDPKTAFLEYVIGDSVLHIFYIDKDQIQWSKSFVSNKRLNQRIKSFHQSLSNYQLITQDSAKAYQAYIKHAHWFYQKLVAPVLKNKKHIQNLVLVTDGELGHLPFETFLTEEADQSITDYSKLPYLVKKYSVSYNYSATLWKENTEALALTNNQQILGIAPNYNMLLDSSLQYIRSPTDQLTRELLIPLPEARREVEMLQQKYRGFFAFDSLASEKTVKEKAADFAILHFATHGVFKTKTPILSSLVFSEDNDSLESNFWQAHEISKTPLNADLVVLSACKTAYGKFEKGNGIASLARSFMYAGAPALIVSLWQVNDFSTSQIMVNLYENLANGMEKDEALRQAKLDYIKSSKNTLAHPAFWSPFIMMGKTDALSIQRKNDPFSWSIWGVGILVLCGAGFMIARRRRKA